MHIRQLPVVVQGILLVLWAIICGLMLLSAIIGLVCVVLGIVSLFVDLSGFLDLQVGGEAVKTAGQKLLFIAVGAGMATTGIAFWRLRGRGYIGGALLCYALLLGLYVVVALATGSPNILSVGGP
jgi:hypothetical protein